jgi:2,5-diketo-D-gluconate reductase B
MPEESSLMSSIYFHQTFQRAFGTFPLQGETLRAALRIALDVGYRAIDTAQSYGNEAEVGSVLAEFGVARNELCITTKVRPENFGANVFIASVERSLSDLRVDQVDVLLLHWPPLDGDISRPLALLEQARDRGLTKYIGVSNYTATMMRRAAALSTGPIVTNQVEFHPLLNQDTLLAAAAETGISLASYCSVARGEVFQVPLFNNLARSYGVSAGQIVLRWILQKGVSINTMSTSRQHIEHNFDLMGFTLSSVDMARIDRLGTANRRLVTRELTPYAPEWDR